MLVRARKEGSDTTLAENLLNQGREALAAGKAMEALQFAARSEGELERVELQGRIAQGTLETVEGKFGAAVSHGIRAPGASAEFEAAKAAYQQKDYPGVLEHSLAASDQLATARDG